MSSELIRCTVCGMQAPAEREEGARPMGLPQGLLVVGTGASCRKLGSVPQSGLPGLARQSGP